MSEKWYEDYKKRKQQQFPDNDDKPEVEPDPENPGSYRIKNPHNQHQPDPAPVPDYKQIIFEADGIEAGRLEDAINKVLEGGEGENHPYYDLKAKPTENPGNKKNVYKNKETPESDSQDLPFE